MCGYRALRRVVLVGTALLLVPLETCRADVATEVRQLTQQFTQQCGAGDYAQAERTALRLRLAEDRLRHVSAVLGRAMEMQARAMTRHGRYDDAERTYQAAILQLEKSGEAGQFDLGIALNGLGDLHRRLAHYAETEPLYRRTQELWEEPLGGYLPECRRGRL